MNMVRVIRMVQKAKDKMLIMEDHRNKVWHEIMAVHQNKEDMGDHQLVSMVINIMDHLRIEIDFQI
jgi:hypothetical protein